VLELWRGRTGLRALEGGGGSQAEEQCGDRPVVPKCGATSADDVVERKVSIIQHTVHVQCWLENIDCRDTLQGSNILIGLREAPEKSSHGEVWKDQLQQNVSKKMCRQRVQKLSEGNKWAECLQ
jgi:hypothetical protein